MSLADAVAGVLALAVAVYLAVALAKPERFQ